MKATVCLACTSPPLEGDVLCQTHAAQADDAMRTLDFSALPPKVMSFILQAHAQAYIAVHGSARAGWQSMMRSVYQGRTCGEPHLQVPPRTVPWAASVRDILPLVLRDADEHAKTGRLPFSRRRGRHGI